MPTIAPTSRDHAPAAQTTVSVAIVPAGGAHAGDAPAGVLDADRRAALQHACAAGDRRRRVALHDGLGAHVPVARAERRGEDALELELGHDLERLGGRELARGHALGVLHLERRAEELDLLGRVEQEEVAVLMERDLGHERHVLADQLVPALELVEAAQREADVELVGELQPRAAGRARGGAARERLALEQHDVGDAARGEMERGAGTHGAAADHDDVCACGNLAHGRMLAHGAGRSSRPAPWRSDQLCGTVTLTRAASLPCTSSLGVITTDQLPCLGRSTLKR